MASGKSNANAAFLLAAIYQAVFTGIGGLLANAASPLTNLFISLHTANPGAGGAQNTSEAAYPGYTRASVSRSTSGWALAGETITNVGVISFPTCGGGSEIETYVGVGTNVSGAGNLLWFGQITTPLTVSGGITPSIPIGDISITES